MFARVGERGAKALGAERLQQVVERVDLEGVQRVFVVRGDEHHGRPALGIERSRQRDAVHFRQVDVEEHQIGRHLVRSPAAASRPSPQAPTTSTSLFLAEQRQQPVARDRFVFDDHRANLDCAHTTSTCTV